MTAILNCQTSANRGLSCDCDSRTQWQPAHPEFLMFEHHVLAVES
jgi:hypothetical protein